MEQEAEFPQLTIRDCAGCGGKFPWASLWRITVGGERHLLCQRCAIDCEIERYKAAEQKKKIEAAIWRCPNCSKRLRAKQREVL